MLTAEGPPFVGRELERSLAAEALDAPGRVLLIHGPAGMGKTRLLRETLSHGGGANSDLLVVLRGRATQLDSDLAFAPIIDALTSHLDRSTPAQQFELLDGLDLVASLLDGYGLPGADPVSAVGSGGKLQRTKRLEQLRRLISRLASHGRSVILAMDDMHWADEGTHAVLAYLSRAVDDGELTMAVTFRDDEVDPSLRDTLSTLRRVGSVTDLRLSPLEQDEVTELLKGILQGEPAASLCRLIIERSAGNCLFVTSLARHIRDNDLLTRTYSGRVRLDPRAEHLLPAEVGDVLASRLDAVEDSPMQVLEAIGVADAPVTEERLAEVTDLDRRAVQDAVDSLVAGGLLAEMPNEALVASHPLIGEAVYRRLSPRRARRLHASFARAMERDDVVDHGRLARHYRQAADAFDADRVIEVLIIAAERALRLTVDREAVQHVQAALEVARTSRPQQVPELLVKLSLVWRNLDEYETSAALLDDAVVLATANEDTPLVVRALGEAATSAYYTGDGERARRLAIQAATLVTPPEPSLVFRLAHVLLAFGPLDDLDDLARSVADRTEDDAYAALVAGTAALSRGDLDEARSMARRVPTLDDGAFGWARPTQPVMRAHMLLGQAGAWAGDEEELAAACREIDDWAARADAPQVAWRVRHAQRELAHAKGAAALPADVTLGELPGRRIDYAVITDAGHRAWSGQPVHLPEGHTHPEELRAAHDLELLRAARVGGSATLAHVALDAPGSTFAIMPPHLLLGRGVAAALLGESDIAAAERRRFVDGSAASSLMHVCGRIIDLAAAEADVAAALGAELLDVAETRGWLRIAAWIARLAAQRAMTGSDGALALATRAVELGVATDETLDADAGRAILREAGITSRPGSTSDGELTPRQQEIAALVARGLSNAEVAEQLFISVRTVTTHLDHIYQRLGISSRHALTVQYSSGKVT